jgi:hypothetical protein
MTPRRIFVALLAVLAALDLVVLAVRLADVASLGRLFLFPAEGPVLYAIWKVGHGRPLYEFPFRPPFTLTLYNFLFYRVYAAIFSALRVGADAVPIAGRWITVVFAALGAAGQYAATRRLVDVPRDCRPAIAFVAIATWFGAALPGWWALAIRPDVPAAAIAVWGVAAALTAFRGGHRGRLVAAGVVFFTAWAFKQSQIALMAATCAYVILWRRSLTEFLLLAAPFAIGAGLALFIGGSVYRANIVDAPRVNALIPYLAIYWYRSVVLTDLLLWGMALWAIVAIVRPGSAHGPLRSLGEVPGRSRLLFGADLTYPALATLLACAIGAVLLAKVGSALNHILELNVAASLVCAGVLAAAWHTPRARVVCRAGSLMLIPMIAFQAALLYDDDGRAAIALQLKGWGTPLHLASRSALHDRERVAAVFATLPPPVFTDDELFAQPRYATGDRYPTVMLDHVFYDTARSKGLVGRGVDGLFADRYFAAAVLPDSSAFLTPALAAGYHLGGTIPQAASEPLRVLLATPQLRNSATPK